MFDHQQRIENLLGAILREVQHMSKQMDDLTAAVKKNDDVVDSAITLITGLAAQILAAKDDPAAIEALAGEISTKADALAAAVTTNTPAAP